MGADAPPHLPLESATYVIHARYRQMSDREKTKEVLCTWPH